MAAPKTTTHRLMLTITFDRKVSAGTARREASNTFYGEQYCGQNPESAETFRVRSIKPLPKESS